MISLFKMKANQKYSRNNVVQDRIATGIVNDTIRLQEKFATYMQCKTERLSRSVKRNFVIAFCFLSSGYSIYLIKGSFTIQQKTHPSFQTIRIPGHIGKAGNDLVKPYEQLSTEEYQNLQRFQHYMDSLIKSASGKKLQDSILRSRPGLMDSIRFMVTRYQLQSLNK